MVSLAQVLYSSCIQVLCWDFGGWKKLSSCFHWWSPSPSSTLAFGLDHVTFFGQLYMGRSDSMPVPSPGLQRPCVFLLTLLCFWDCLEKSFLQVVTVPLFWTSKWNTWRKPQPAGPSTWIRDIPINPQTQELGKCLLYKWEFLKLLGCNNG